MRGDNFMRLKIIGIITIAGMIFVANAIIAEQSATPQELKMNELNKKPLSVEEDLNSIATEGGKKTITPKSTTGNDDKFSDPKSTKPDSMQYQTNTNVDNEDKRPEPRLKNLDSPTYENKTTYPSWHWKLLSTYRFELVMDGKAVLDKETGLVWVRDVKIFRFPGPSELETVAPPPISGPITIPNERVMMWDDAIERCANIIISNRKGWRLPNREELASLLDMSAEGSPKLPSGHPFINVENGCYWTSTQDVSKTSFIWIVNMSDGNITTSKKDKKCYIWPVRSGN